MEKEKEKELDGSNFLRKLKHTVSEKISTETVKEKMANLSNQLASGFNSMTNHELLQATLGGKNSPLSPRRSSQGEKSNGTDKKLGAGTKYEVSDYKITQYEHILQADDVDLPALRKLGWNGVPAKFRSVVWQLLLGYMPTHKARRASAIARKRQEYHEVLQIYFYVPDSDKTSQEIEIHRQILKDIPRTCPDSPFFQQEPIQRAMERILYVWSIRHPASGYVQGMDDLLTPMLYLALHQFVSDDDVFRVDAGKLDSKVLKDFEADAYWCFSKLLDNIQDHYTFSQPGLQRMNLRLEDLIHRLDITLYNHFQTETIQYMQFGFRWMNCLLLRELPFPCILRLWDTYISEQTGGFENFHVYVCAVILKTFQSELLEMKYEELLIFLQDLPTKDWDEEKMEPILSQAFILSTLFDNSPSHLN